MRWEVAENQLDRRKEGKEEKRGQRWGREGSREGRGSHKELRLIGRDRGSWGGIGKHRGHRQA